MRLEYALVTGASSGIGLEMARLLAIRGYNLLMVSNEKEKLHALQVEFQSVYAIQVHALAINLATDDAAQKVYDYTTKHAMEVEVLVNNAGFFFFGEVADAPLAKASDMVHLHVLTVSALCTLFAQRMRQRKCGYILNISSISAHKAFPGIAYYGASKAYIRSFTQSLRTELKYYGVHVTCLSPGATATALYDPNVINVELGRKVGVMMDAADVAQAGIKALFSNQGEVVPGVLTKIMLFLAVLTPQWVIYLIRKHSRYLK